MRPILILVLLLSAVAQSPKEHTGNKQNTQPQVDKHTNNQGGSDTGKAPETHFYTYNNQRKEENETAKEMGDYLLAAFTGTLVIVSLMQWAVLRKHEEWMQKHDANLEKLANSAKDNAEAARKSAEIAEMAVKLSERADVLVQAAVLDLGQTIGGGDSRVVLRFKNFGNTRATDVTLSLNLSIEGVPDTDSSRIPPITMGKGDEQTISSARFIEFLNLETARNVLSGRMPLRFETQALYQDVFGTAHRTFCAGTFDTRTRGFEINRQETT
jgi:hypothetical protein